MRKIRIMEHISLDGVIQAPGGRDEDGDYPYGGWTVPYRDPVSGKAFLVQETGLCEERQHFVRCRRHSQGPKIKETRFADVFLDFVGVQVLTQKAVWEVGLQNAFPRPVPRTPETIGA